MTVNFDLYWSITVTHASRIGPKHWRATAHAHRRDTQKAVGDSFEGFGSKMNSADTAAQRAVEDFLSRQPPPKGWKQR